MPRAGIGAVSVPLLVALERLGLIGDARTGIASAVDQLVKRPGRSSVPPAEAARDLARRIGRTLAIVYGGGRLGEVGGLAVEGPVQREPEGRCVRQPRSGAHPQRDLRVGPARRRHPTGVHAPVAPPRLRAPPGRASFRLVEEVCEEIVGGVHSVHAEGDGPLAQFMDLVMIGDLVTLHMAVAGRVSTRARSRSSTTSRPASAGHAPALVSAGRWRTSAGSSPGGSGQCAVTAGERVEVEDHDPASSGFDELLAAPQLEDLRHGIA